MLIIFPYCAKVVLRVSSDPSCTRYSYFLETHTGHRDVYTWKFPCVMFVRHLPLCIPCNCAYVLLLPQFNVNLPFWAIYFYHAYLLFRKSHGFMNPFMNVESSDPWAGWIESTNYHILTCRHFTSSLYSCTLLCVFTPLSLSQLSFSVRLEVRRSAHKIPSRKFSVDWMERANWRFVA